MGLESSIVLVLIAVPSCALFFRSWFDVDDGFCTVFSSFFGTPSRNVVMYNNGSRLYAGAVAAVGTGEVSRFSRYRGYRRVG